MNKEAIKSALSAIPIGDFLAKSKDLLSTIGYRSELTLELSGTVHDFFEEFPPLNPNTKTEQEFRKHAESAQIIFQFTKDEIEEDPEQMTLLESNAFDKGNIKSFLFCAVELKDNTYSRTKYAEFTREINKRLFAPTVILFRAGNRLTVAFADRRPDKTDEDRDVLGQVTLIKDIRLNNPHSAHLDILSELSLEECVKWMNDNKKPKNFDGLLAAWLAKLDTEELNKQFYRKLFAWYEWAIDTATFPTDENRVIKPEEHVIRLITRLLFIWFIKEKGLVADVLFNKAQIQDLLKEDDFDNGDSYYRAVLQNLFFATLNTEINKRRFSTRTNKTHRNPSVYRYKAQMRDPDKLLEMFSKTPFINGGLFDCLDSEEAIGDGGYRIDCFSDKQYHKLSIPNRLFFKRKIGLLSIFGDYKFTVEENTPIEQEVALDPELLGRVFEHLLAELNDNTKKAAESRRKKNGAYYTPRVIVDYMVEEALVASLSQRCQPTDGKMELWGKRLHYLFDYAKVCDDASEWFDNKETDAIVKTISEIKILDPAVGSGAFPMGVLHKLTLALRRLDPDNTGWEALQRKIAVERSEEAYNTQDQGERNDELKEISNTFERYRDSDFGRKLYLIQNSIFGTDIESLACQIAKLRFFISLAIEQKPDTDPKNNYGIKPLPNLETRFVVANTLIGLKKVEEMFASTTVRSLEQELWKNRERHFHATTRTQKRACRTSDKGLRKKLATELKTMDMPSADAEKIAQWDPYDQNGKADWFDPELMFGITDGFDVVIGNPPYIKEYINKEAFDGIRESPYYQGKMDIWYMFACKGLDFVKKDNGLVTFIAQNNWVTSDGASIMRNKVIQDAQILSLVDFGSFKIFSSGIQTMVMVFRKNIESDNYLFDYRRLLGKDLNINDVIALLNRDQNNKAEYINPKIKRSKYTDTTLTFSDHAVELILDKISSKRDFILQKKEVAQGIVCPQDSVNADSKKVLGNNYNVGDGVFVLNQNKKGSIPFTQKELDVLKPFFTTKELGHYYGKPANEHWVIYTDSSFKNEKQIEDYPNIKKHLDQFQKIITSHNKPYGLHRGRDPYIFLGEKIISVRKCARPTFTYVDFDSYVSQTFFIIKTGRVNQKFLTGMLNSGLVTFWLKHKGKMQGTNYQIDKTPLLSIPLIYASPEQQTPIIELVDQILKTKHTDLEADTSDLENEIDKLVYKLYDLKEDEIAIMKGNV